VNAAPQSLSCLLVDDSSTIRTIVRPMLVNLGCRVTEAADGQQALEACAKELPVAILLDWNMPVMNGLDFLKALRATPGGDAPVVIFCTTENDISRISAAIEAGANEYIMKPFDQEILRSKFLQVGLIGE
jgi:two-component system chemotaxis response regulator CheY